MRTMRAEAVSLSNKAGKDGFVIDGSEVVAVRRMLVMSRIFRGIYTFGLWLGNRLLVNVVDRSRYFGVE